MTNIANIKVWWNDSKTEKRVYVRTVDGRNGCYYVTGNRWNPKKTTDGKLTDAEWKEARELSVVDGKWTTVYESVLHGTIFGVKVNNGNPFSREEDVRTDIEEERNFVQVDRGEPEIYG